MRSQARVKTGNKRGNPAYRTPSRMLSREYGKHKGVLAQARKRGKKTSLP